MNYWNDWNIQTSLDISVQWDIIISSRRRRGDEYTKNTMMSLHYWHLWYIFLVRIYISLNSSRIFTFCVSIRQFFHFLHLSLFVIWMAPHKWAYSSQPCLYVYENILRRRNFSSDLFKKLFTYKNLFIEVFHDFKLIKFHFHVTSSSLFTRKLFLWK